MDGEGFIFNLAPIGTVLMSGRSSRLTLIQKMAASHGRGALKGGGDWRSGLSTTCYLQECLLGTRSREHLQIHDDTACSLADRVTLGILLAQRGSGK